MSAVRALLTVLLTVVFSLGLSSAALADPGLIVGDGTPVAPGTMVRAQMGCESPDTTPVAGEGVTGSPWRRDAEGHQPWAVFSDVTVGADADAGPVTVTASCGGVTQSATITVAGTGPSAWTWAGGALALLAIAAVMVLLLRRRRVSP